MLKLRIFLISVLLLLPSTPLATMTTDDVERTIGEAIRQYRAGDYKGAASNLDYASQLVRQKKSETMQGFLPEPLTGWTGSEATGQTVGTAILGGGMTVSRDYNKGAAKLSVEIISDSPVLQSVLLLIKNPLFAGADGSKLTTIDGQRAIKNFDAQSGSGDLTIVIDDRLLVIVKGEQLAESDLVAYAQAIDYQALSKS